jgi:L-threonylcarbamoyladenylate synthase
VPDEVTAGLGTVAIRVPAHPVARALLEAVLLPVAAPSANLFSRPSPTRASHVVNDLDGRVDVILDGGPTTVGLESTVIDLSGPTPTVLRPGAISIDALRAVLPDTQLGNAPARPAHDPAAMPSPGLLLRHYSPRTPLVLYEGEPAAALTRLVADARAALAAGVRIGVLASSEDAVRVREALGGAVHLFDLGSRGDPRTTASRLYEGLRELDGTGADLLLARGVDSNEGLWLAVRDRLRRAAGRIVSL